MADFNTYTNSAGIVSSSGTTFFNNPVRNSPDNVQVRVSEAPAPEFRLVPNALNFRGDLTRDGVST